MAYDFEQLKQDVVSAGKEIGEKAKELSDTAKTKVDIQGKKRELDKLYAALGRVYYAAHKGENVPEDVMFRGIERAEAELTALKQKLEE